MTEGKTSSAEGISWDLTDFYQDSEDPGIERDFAISVEMADSFRERYRGKVETGKLKPGELYEAVKEYETIYETIGKVASFAWLYHSQNTQEPKRGALFTKTQQKISEVSNKLIFFQLEWQSLEDTVADEYMGSPELGKYKNYLKHWRRYTPHMLSEKEEQIVESLQITGKKALVRLFDEIIGDTTVSIEVDGEKKDFVLDQALSKLYDSNRELRKAAAKGITEALSGKKKFLTFVFNNIVLNHSTICDFRGYPDPMTPRNLDNRVKKETVDALMQACLDNTDIVHDFYRLMKDMLGYDTLYDHDRYCPLPGDTPDVTYEESKAHVLEAYGKFSPELRDIVVRFFEEGWIDAELKPGKRGGAFSASAVPSVHPYILLNFTDKTRDMTTMAHELGHGVHQYLAREQGYLQQRTPLTTAEMASVFGEMLLFDKLMGEVKDPHTKLNILGHKLKDDFATVFRQVIMTRFEQKLHKERMEKGELRPEQINELWLEANREEFGDTVVLTDDYGWWWSYVLHFVHYPFYCYAYAFGELLVLALYDMYREQGKEFVPKYIDLLRRGGSEDPEDMLRRIGADITDPHFWERGLAVLREQVKMVEELAEELELVTGDR